MKVLGIQTERRTLLYLAGDLALLLAALSLGHAARFGFGSMEAQPWNILQVTTGACVFFAATNFLSMYVFDGYNASKDYRRPVRFVVLFTAVAFALIAQMVLFYAFPTWWWGRGVAATSNLAFAVLAILMRVTVCTLRPLQVLRVPTLIIGANEAGGQIALIIQTHPEHDRSYDLVGFVADEDQVETTSLPVVGTTADVMGAVRRTGAQLIIVGILNDMSTDLTRELLECKKAGVQIEDMRTIYRNLTGKIAIEHLSHASLIFGPSFAGTVGVGAAAQRLADIAIAAVALLLTWPVILVAGIAVRMETPGPALFLQERVGLNEQPFTIIKLRTMGIDAEAATGPVWSTGSMDVRVTRVGRFLRRSRIDELPQFWNVLRGDMSIVGPRPERASFVRQLEEEIPFYALRFAVKPGITGWAQVKYRYGASTEDSAEKLRYDLFAVQELTPMLYLLIVLKTVQTVVMRPGS